MVQFKKWSPQVKTSLKGFWQEFIWNYSMMNFEWAASQLPTCALEVSQRVGAFLLRKNHQNGWMVYPLSSIKLASAESIGGGAWGGDKDGGSMQCMSTGGGVIPCWGYWEGGQVQAVRGTVPHVAELSCSKCQQWSCWGVLVDEQSSREGPPMASWRWVERAPFWKSLVASTFVCQEHKNSLCY